MGINQKIKAMEQKKADAREQEHNILNNLDRLNRQELLHIAEMFSNKLLNLNKNDCRECKHIHWKLNTEEI